MSNLFDQHRRKSWLSLVLVLLLGCSLQGLAQEPPNPPSGGEAPGTKGGDAGKETDPAKKPETEPEPAPKKDSVKPHELVVTATRTEEAPEDVPQSILSASRYEIDCRQPLNPIEALRDEPGIWIQKTGGGGGTPVVRGFMGNQVLYLIDGIRINNGKLFSGPNPFFNQFDLGFIDQIEVLKGPGCVQYGSDAIGGVIQLRTKNLTIFPDELEVGGQGTAHYSTADRGKYAHLEGHAALKFVNVLLGGSLADAEDYRGGKGAGLLENTAYRSYGGILKARFRIASGHILTVGVLESFRRDVDRYDQSQRNQPSGIPRFFSPKEDRSLVYVRDEIRNVAGKWLSLEPYVYYLGYKSEGLFTVESASQVRTDLTETTQNAFGGGIQAKTDVIDQLRFVYGADIRFESLRDHKTRDTLDKALNSRSESKPGGQSPDGRYDSYDAYALADFRPIESLRFTLGGRFESSHLNSSPSDIDASAGFTVDDLDINKRWNSVTGSAGALWWIVEGLGVAGNVATGFRSPNYADVLAFGPFTYGTSVPSPGVKPEKSIGYDVGPRADFKWLSAQVTWHQTFLRDLLTNEATGGFVDLNGSGTEDPGEAAYARKNTGRGEVHGVEAYAELRPLDQLSFFGSFAWTMGKNRETDEPLRQIPPVNGVVGVRFHPLGDKLEIEGFARMVRHQSRITLDDKSDPARASDPAETFPSPTNRPLREDYSIPGYTTLHLRATWEIRKGVRVFGSVDNILNKHYREAWSRQDALGFGVTLGLKLEF